MSAHCRYAAADIAHTCTVSTGQERHGNQTCQFEARAELAELHQQGVNGDRTLTIKGALHTGEPCTIVITVPQTFVDAWRTGA